MQNKPALEGYQLSPQQSRIWLLQQADGSQAYRAQAAILIEGDVDMEVLRAAISEIVNRHEILRTNFHLLSGMTIPLQTIEFDQAPSIRKIDLSDCDNHEKSMRVDELFLEETRPCLDLKPAPMTRFCLLLLSASERILVVSLPSICADSRSLKNLFQEIASTYAALSIGAELTGQTVQYVDFAEWQKEMLEREDDVNKSWDRQNPHFSSSQLILGLEHVGNTPFVYSPAFVSSALNAEIAKEIDRISSNHKVTSDVFLLACWQLFAWRLTGRKEVIIDALSEGRRLRGLTEAVGSFASFCPTYSHIEPDYQFVEMLEIAHQSARSADERLNHILRQDGEPTVDRGVKDRAEAVGFEYEEWPAALSAGAARFSYWKQSVCIDRFKLKLGAYRKADGLLVEIQFDPGVYTRGGVELILERYLRLIESAICDSEGLIGELEIVGRRERRRLLVEWNDTNSDACEDRPIHELIGEQARLRPEAIAAVYRQEQLSYLELDGRANQVARELRRLGVGAESVVGLYIERSVEMMIGLLGILKAGGAYLPVEVGQPERRVRGMLEDAGVRVLVTSEEAGKRLPDVGYVKLRLDRDWEEIGRNSREAPEVKVWMENLAYVIYTSGSTGKPKGVMVEHGSVVNLLEGLSREVYEGEGEGLRVSVNAPLVFDASVKQVIQAGRGSRICIVPEDERVDVEKLLEYVREQGIEVFDCTPSQLRVLMEGGLGKGGREPKKVLVGGERIEEEMWEEMCKSEEVRYYNLYGPTECTVDATVSEVREGREATIGRPISNTRVYILDEKGGMRATGVVGEIYIGGRGVGRGYLGEEA